MRLLTFSHADARPRIGAWLDDDIIDLEAAHREVHPKGEAFPASLKSLIASGSAGMAAARRALEAGSNARTRARLRCDQVQLLPPIPDARLFFCVGKNNKSHLDELVRNNLIKEIPKEPTGFVKLTSVMVGDDAAVVRPNGITTLDYEPELTFVIGKRAFGVAGSAVGAYVAG